MEAMMKYSHEPCFENVTGLSEIGTFAEHN